jgi:tRNA dimethylallyltransferase
MKSAFFIVGPTAVGKSELGADVAADLGAEIVSADAFQIYEGFNLLTAKPEAAVLAKAPHHLVGTMSIREEMNAEKFRQLATGAIYEIHSRGKLPIIVGGSGLYVKALTHGLTSVPESDPELRAGLNEMTLDQLREKIRELDPETARRIDLNNRRRLARAIEICLLSGKPASVVTGVGDSGRPGVRAGLACPIPATGVFVFRDRDELYQRINSRVEEMFRRNVIDEVRTAGPMSSTALQMIGLRNVQDLLTGKISTSQCIGTIQQATRRYAKRQLTWFRHQTNFKVLNLSLLTHQEAVKWISQRAKTFRVGQGND